MFLFRHLVGFPTTPGIDCEDLGGHSFVADDCSDMGDLFLHAAMHTMTFTGEMDTNQEKEVIVCWMVIDFLESNFDEATKVARANSHKEFEHTTRNFMQFSWFVTRKEAVNYLKGGGLLKSHCCLLLWQSQL